MAAWEAVAAAFLFDQGDYIIFFVGPLQIEAASKHRYEYEARKGRAYYH